jgi:hypothetical protein
MEETNEKLKHILDEIKDIKNTYINHVICLKRILSKLDSINKTLKILTDPEKGQLSSFNGMKYEKQVYNVVKNCFIDGEKFNIQDEKELGGVSPKNDLVCKYKNEDVCIEIKKYNSPDWVQCGVKYDIETKKWKTTKSAHSKTPQSVKELFDNLINNAELFGNNIPPFSKKRITYDEWLKIKTNTTIWDDKYIDIPNDTIRKLYSLKGCKYIQLSNGFGLYHLGHDICNFKVPIFEIKQRIRVRIKVHSKENNKGVCLLSVIASCQPQKINSIEKSSYSLDDEKRLPSNLRYHN